MTVILFGSASITQKYIGVTNTILLATLGESPVVVTATARKLLAEGVPLSTVRVAYPADDVSISMGFDMIVEALGDAVTVQQIPLPFADPASYADSLTFLQHMNGWLEMHQQQNDAVYLSLAGGRKNMSALLSVMAQFYPCVQKLLHVHDRTNSHFINLNDLYGKPGAARNNLLNPPVADFDLIEIPFQQLANAGQLFKVLKQTTIGDANNSCPAIAPASLLPDATVFFEKIFSGLPAKPLTIRFTQSAFDQACEWLHDNADHAHQLQGYLQVMCDAVQLDAHAHGVFTHANRRFHFCKRRRTAERPFYYAKADLAQSQITQQASEIVIVGLSIERDNGSYEPTEKYWLSKGDFEPVKDLRDLPWREQVLIAPLGEYPMVVTQALSLLEQQLNARAISLTQLVYFEQHGLIKQGAHILQRVLEQRQISCDMHPLALVDVMRSQDCETYLRELVRVIRITQQENPDKDVALLLSGGRKGMSALGLLAAQMCQIARVYHTVITDDVWHRHVEEVCSIAQLRTLSIKDQSLRLFPNQVAQCAVIFSLPVLPLA